jgi:hypothetical protein
MKDSNLKIQFFSILLLSIALLALMSLRSLDNSIENHQQFLKQTQQLEHRSHLLNEEILKAQQGLLRNYDDIIIHIKYISDQIQQLHLQTVSVKNTRNDDNEDYNSLLKASDTLGNSVDQFLTNHAIVNNSIASIPVLIKTLKKFDPANAQLAKQLLIEVLLFVRWQETAAAAATKNNIKQTLATLAKNTNIKNLKANEIFSFIKIHSEIILSITPHVIKNLEYIINGELTSTLLQVQSNEIDRFNHKMKQKQYFDYAIYSISLLLILFVFCFIFALRRSRHALKKEILFLNTLLDTISDGVVACNKKGEV